MLSGAGTCDEEQTLLLMLLREPRLFDHRQPFRSLDHALRGRATLATVRYRKAHDCQARNVNTLEFEAFTAMHGHQTDGIYMKCPRRNLAKVTLFGKQHQ